jgi:hypothetical protein
VNEDTVFILKVGAILFIASFLVGAIGGIVL